MARLNHVKRFRGTTKTEDGCLTCGRCGDKIRPGDAYRWWANRAPGMRSGHKKIRCMKDSCAPTLAERTPGRRGQLLGIQDDIEKAIAAAASLEDLTAVRDDAAQQIRDLGQELVDGADNMEGGFGHETYQSQELRERGEALDELADEIEQLEPEGDEIEPESADLRDEVAMDEFGADGYDELDDEQKDAVAERIAERAAAQVDEFGELVSEKVQEAEV